MLMKGYFKTEQGAIDIAAFFSNWEQLQQFERKETPDQPARIYVYFDSRGYYLTSRFCEGDKQQLITIFENGVNVGK